MKRVKRALRNLLAAYLAACVLASLLASAGIRSAIDHRCGLVVVEFVTVTVAGMNPWGKRDGVASDGTYIAYSGNFPEGAHVLSAFLWNPANNFCDDVLWRGDALLPG